ncbi:GNAT family N-acetyltransferase [Lacrimispora sp.]|uniref:GNAT family N-acetyltransferase n=1 Tax=Lacrimispora sp. TaxID=2719234 RepID=UPI0028AFA4AC|nr:GNAT family N-acetyltransferase [Lacrimispora sp.]
MIRYLKQEEKVESKKLWEKVFSEDSESFVHYYYSDRVFKNQVLAAYKDENMAAMLHRNPYEVVVKDHVWTIDYVAGVATASDFRHQGYMRRLLDRCFLDMYEERMPFCFLVPVNPAIYQPFDFTYISDLSTKKLNQAGITHLNRRAFMERSDECKEVSDFVERQLEKQYEVYALRNEEYYRDLSKEVRSDSGDMILLTTKAEKETLAGVWAYYGETAGALRELICLPEYVRESSQVKPYAMGRIIHLERFVSVINLKEESPVSEMEMLIEIKDKFIPRNNGLFLWKLDRKGSSISPVKESGLTPHISLTISEMTSWLFGYSLPSVSADAEAMVDRIRPLKGVFFNEVT